MVLKKAYGISVFRDFFVVIEDVRRCFTASPTRTRLLKEEVNTYDRCAIARCNHCRRRLKAYCASGWVKRHDLITVLVELLFVALD